MKKKILGVTAIVAVIAMAACASLTIVSVDWDSMEGPSKTRQYLGVSSSEVTVYANYKDESRKKVTFLTAAHDRDRTGNQTVTVSVIGGPGTGTFQTEVMELLSIRVDRAPSKTSYNVGERADLAGIKVMGSWRDLPDAEVPAYQVTVASFDSSSAGNKVVTIDFKGKRATFNVTVTAPSAPAPAASQPSQPAQQQQPSAQQQAGSTDRAALVGTWMRRGSGYTHTYVFNADGTGIATSVPDSNPNNPLVSVITSWTVSGDQLTYLIPNSSRPDVIYTNIVTFRLSGNTFRMWTEANPNNYTDWTRQ